MRRAVLPLVGLWLAACAGHTPSPGPADRGQCLAEQAARLGPRPDARATAELLCTASFTETLLVRCQDGLSGEPDAGCSCPRRLTSLGPDVGCRLSEGPDWENVPCGTPVDLCGTATRCTCD